MPRSSIPTRSSCPLLGSQRFTGTFSDNGGTIAGQWQLCEKADKADPETK